MYISGGENVYPAEIENVLAEMPQVAGVAVVAIDDKKWGQVGLAAIRQKAATELSEDEARTYCREHLAAYKVPRYFQFVSEIPVNAQGKVMKKAIKDRFEANASL